MASPFGADVAVGRNVISNDIAVGIDVQSSPGLPAAARSSYGGHGCLAGVGIADCRSMIVPVVGGRTHRVAVDRKQGCEGNSIHVSSHYSSDACVRSF